MKMNFKIKPKKEKVLIEEDSIIKEKPEPKTRFLVSEKTTQETGITQMMVDASIKRFNHDEPMKGREGLLERMQRIKEYNADETIARHHKLSKQQVQIMLLKSGLDVKLADLAYPNDKAHGTAGGGNQPQAH